MATSKLLVLSGDSEEDSEEEAMAVNGGKTNAHKSLTRSPDLLLHPAVPLARIAEYLTLQDVVCTLPLVSRVVNQCVFQLLQEQWACGKCQGPLLVQTKTDSETKNDGNQHHFKKYVLPGDCVRCGQRICSNCALMQCEHCSIAAECGCHPPTVAAAHDWRSPPTGYNFEVCHSCVEFKSIYPNGRSPRDLVLHYCGPCSKTCLSTCDFHPDHFFCSQHPVVECDNKHCENVMCPVHPDTGEAGCGDCRVCRGQCGGLFCEVCTYTTQPEECDFCDRFYCQDCGPVVGMECSFCHACWCAHDVSPCTPQCAGAMLSQPTIAATQTDHVCMDELACANCIPHKMRTCHHCHQWFCNRDGLRCCTNEECGVAFCSNCCQTLETIREMPQSCSDCGLRCCYECNSGLYVPCADCSKLLQLEDKGSPSTGGVPPCDECHTFDKVELQTCHGACQGAYCSHVEFSGSSDDRVVSQCSPCRRFFPCSLNCDNLLCHRCIRVGNRVCQECLENKGGGKEKKRKRQKDTTTTQKASFAPEHEKDSGNPCKQATEDRKPSAEAEQAVTRSTKERPFSEEAATSTPRDSAQESTQPDDDENDVSSDASEPIIHRRPRAGVVQKRDLFGDSSDSDEGI